MNPEYYSCQFIEGGLLLGFSTLHFCCIPNDVETGVKICDFSGGDLPLKTLLAFRESVRSRNQTPERFPNCRKCYFLEKKHWPTKAYPLDHIIFSHFTSCNLRCSYCPYTKNDGHGQHPRYSLYPVVKNMIDNRLMAPESSIYWGGGEPTTLKEFGDVLSLLLEYGIRQQKIVTNATKFSEAVSAGLTQGLITVVTSIDAGTPETYTRIRGANLFDRAWDNLSRYAATGGPVYAKMILLPENRSEIGMFLLEARKRGVTGVIYDIDMLGNDHSEEIIEAVGSFIISASELGLNVAAGDGFNMLADSYRSEVFARIASRLSARLGAAVERSGEVWLVDTGSEKVPLEKFLGESTDVEVPSVATRLRRFVREKWGRLSKQAT